MVSASASAPPWNSELRSAALLALAYFVAAYLALRFTRLEGGVALIWLATPLLCVDLRYRPERSWLLRAGFCVPASIAATMMWGLGTKAALPMAVINIGEGLAIAWLMRRFVPEPKHLSSLGELGLLILFAGIIVPGTTAFPAAAVAHLAAGVPYWENWLEWYTAHALGTLTIMPIVKLVLGGDLRGWIGQSRGHDRAEAAGLFTVLTGITVAVFVQTSLPLLFVPFLPMMIIVFRIGRLGAAVSLLVLTVVGTLCTINGLGPVTLAQGGAGLKLQFFQSYLAVAALMVLPAAAELKRRKEQFLKLQESAALYQVIADRSGDIILAVKADGTIQFTSASMTAIAGYHPDYVTGRGVREIVVAEDVPAVLKCQQEAMERPDETAEVEFRARRASGDVGWFENHARAIVDEDGAVTGTINVVREVSRRKARELDLSRAADTDPLTGLPNRRVLQSAYDRLTEPQARQTEAYLALFDLDHFKLVNDRYGHGTGDEVLKRFSNVMAANVRSVDTTVRLGGEEFAAVLSNLSFADAQSACERIREQFAGIKVRSSEGASVSATVSVGLARVRIGIALADAIEEADKALYEAKRLGRNRLAFAA
jgi:diguanylate cyclase (GGDEF)-like protein/PAS domain S-box-containing protein